MPLNILPIGISRRGTTIVGAKDVAPANFGRHGMTFQNTSDTAMMLTEDGTDASATVGYYVPAGAGVNISTGNRVSVYCATASKTYEATEW